MKVENLKNALVFMDRVAVTGKEAIAWVQTYADLQADLAAATAPVKTPAPTDPGSQS